MPESSLYALIGPQGHGYELLTVLVRLLLYLLCGMDHIVSCLILSASYVQSSTMQSQLKKNEVLVESDRP